MATRSNRQRVILSNHPRIEAVWLTTLASVGNLALLAIPALTVASGLTFVWLIDQAQTPLDWVVVEFLAAVTLTGMLCSWDLYSIRSPELNGVAMELEASDAPGLFAMVNRRVARFKLKEVDRIVLGDQPEIRVEPYLRRGFPGAERYTLYLGWPLMYLLDTDQFRVALRAAIGQWSPKSPEYRFTTFLCRQAAFWAALRTHYQARRRLAGWLLRRPISRFADYFENRTTEARRSQSFVHDQVGQRYSNDGQMLAVLAGQVVSRAYLDAKFWPWIKGTAVRTSVPVVKPFTNFLPITEQMLSAKDAARWLLQALGAAADTRVASLRERLAVLGYEGIQWQGIPGQSAVETIFGQNWTSLADRLDQCWREQVRDDWREIHEQFQRESREFYALKIKARNETVVGSEAVRYLRLMEKYVKPAEQAALCKKILQDNRIWPDVCYQCGRMLLAVGDDAGIRALEQAMHLDQAYVTRAPVLINNFEKNQRVIHIPRPMMTAAVQPA